MINPDLASKLVPICDLLSSGDIASAKRHARAELPFTPALRERSKRAATPHQKTRLFVRDDFFDRYTGRRVVFPPVLRLLSWLLPEEFPYDSAWKYGIGHDMYWELYATVDHVAPIAIGGSDDPDNWVTCSMRTNGAKNSSKIGASSWTLLPPGEFREWDGLLCWLVTFCGHHPEAKLAPGVKEWISPARSVLRELD